MIDDVMLTAEEKMQKYWANFARTGDPNGAGLTQWQPYAESRKTMRLAVPECEMIEYKEKQQ